MLLTAAIVPLVFVAYQLLIDWVNLFPWNDLSQKTAKTKLLEFLINYLPLFFISFAYVHPSHTAFLWGMIGSLLYLAGHIRAWWIPYFFGASEKEQAEYQHYFSCTYKFLPPRKGNPVPDAEHVVLGSICLLMTVLNTVIFFTYPI